MNAPIWKRQNRYSLINESADCVGAFPPFASMQEPVRPNQTPAAHEHQRHCDVRHVFGENIRGVGQPNAARPAVVHRHAIIAHAVDADDFQRGHGRGQFGHLVAVVKRFAVIPVAIGTEQQARAGLAKAVQGSITAKVWRAAGPDGSQTGGGQHGVVFV